MSAKKILAAVAGVLLAMAAALPSHAQHASLNPMAPRQIYKELSNADYSYGYTILPGNSIDGIEPFNRYVGWSINYYAVDRYFLRPLAHGYSHLPAFVQDGVDNFFSNVSDVNATVNNLFLGQFADSGTSFARFLINSTIGLLGLFDPATHLGIKQHSMSFDTVMGRYGADQGEYLMIPFYGPGTERSVEGSTVDSWYYYLIGEPFVTVACYLIKGINTRAKFISQEKFVDDAVDPYATMRQLYLSYEQGLVDPNAQMKDNGKQDQQVDDSYLDEIDSN